MSRIVALAAVLMLLPLSAQPAETHAGPVVFIAGFTDAAGSSAWEPIARAVTDLLVGAVAASSRIRLVDREHLEILLREQQLALSGLSERSNAARIGNLLGADRMVVGRIVVDGEHLSLIAHIVDVHTTQVLGTSLQQGPRTGLFNLVTALAAELCAVLEIPFDPGRVADIDNNPIVSLNLLRGLGFFYTGEYDLAIRDFMTSGDLDPDLTERHYWKARAYMALEDFELARLELTRFLTASPDADRAPEARHLLAECTLVLENAPRP